MPLSQLLEMYGYGNETENPVQETEEEESVSRAPSESGGEDQLDIVSVEHSALKQLYDPVPNEEAVGTSRLLRCKNLSLSIHKVKIRNVFMLLALSRPQSEEEDEDYDYSPDEDEWKKVNVIIIVNWTNISNEISA